VTSGEGRRGSALTVAAAGVTVVLWAAAFVAIRYVGHEISAGPLALGRLVVGSVVLGIVLLVRRGEGRGPGRDRSVTPAGSVVGAERAAGSGAAEAVATPAGPAAGTAATAGSGDVAVDRDVELASAVAVAAPESGVSVVDATTDRSDGTGRGRAGWSGGTWMRLIAIGVLWFGVYNVALNAAERRIDAGTASMLVNVGPILIAVLAGLVLHEGFPGRLLVGSAVAFVGVVLIGLSSSHHSAGNAWGVVLCVVAAVAYSIAVVTQKPLLGRLSALRVTWTACTVGAIVCLPFLGQLVHELRRADAAAIAWVVFLGAMPTALAFTTWAYALARTSAGKLGATTYLVPPIAILLGWVFLGEAPAALAYAGGVLCLLGVYITRRPTRVTSRAVEARASPGSEQPD
jgi:drug/metabolite transporter (DMT)-like permease